jgi:hypothetical protein
MYKKALNLVSGLKSKLNYLSAFAFVAVATLASGNLFAQTNTGDQPLKIVVPGQGIDWTDASKSILDQMFGVMGPVIGLAIAFWIVAAGWQFIRKTAKP